MKLKRVDIFQAKTIRGATKIPTELRYRIEVRLLRRRRQIADRHVLDHAAAKRADLSHRKTSCLKNGPAAPELRRDAHDCIMVVILTDQPNTRLRGKSAPDRELPSELSLLARTTSPDQHSLPPCS